jgi:hypothetical protein
MVNRLRAPLPLHLTHLSPNEIRKRSRSLTRASNRCLGIFVLTGPERTPEIWPRGLIQKRTTIVEIRPSGRKRYGQECWFWCQNAGAESGQLSGDFGNFWKFLAIPGSFPAIFQPAWTSPDSARTHAENGRILSGQKPTKFGKFGKT